MLMVLLFGYTCIYMHTSITVYWYTRIIAVGTVCYVVDWPNDTDDVIAVFVKH